MRLTDLHPRWIASGGEGVTDADGRPVPRREGIGVSFDCPCSTCGLLCFVPFDNPLDGGPPITPDHALWTRTGEDFDHLSLTPSILRNRERDGCGWHGYVTDGEVITI